MSDLSRLQAAEPIIVTDGNNPVAVLGSTPVGTEYGLVARLTPSPFPVTECNYATYAASTAFTLTLTSAGVTNSLAYLFHPSTIAKRYEIKQILVTTYNGTGTSADFMLKVCRITAENGVPLGTTLAPVSFDQSDPASSAVFRYEATGAPTRTSVDAISVGYLAANNNTFEVQNQYFKPLVCYPGVSEGWEVRYVNGPVASTMKFGVTFIWTEQ